jgi:hypothetical protein
MFKKINVNEYQMGDLEFIEDENVYISEIGRIEVESDLLKIFKVGDDNITFEFGEYSNEFYKFIINLEDGIKELIINNGERLFGGEVDLENLFRKSIMLPNDLSRGPTINFKLSHDIEIYDRSLNKINTDKLKNNITNVIVKFHIERIQFYKSKCNILYIVDEIYTLWEDSNKL